MKLLERYKKMSPMPDVGDFIFLFVLYLPLYVLPNMLFADGSTGWHLVAGDYILDNHKVPYTDLISYTHPDKAWVAYEWLFDLILSIMNQIGGTNLIAVCLSIVLGYIFLCIYDKARAQGCGIALSSFLVVVAILVSAMHWLARPHLMEYVCLLIFVCVLDRFYKGQLNKSELILSLCLTMLFWTNFHPSFALGCIVTGIYLLVTLCQTVFAKSIEQQQIAKTQSISLFIALIASGFTTFINPYGIKLHLYILSYLEGQEILKATNEYMSPVFHGGMHSTCLELLFIAFIVGLSTKKRLSTPTLLISLLFAHAALSGVRNMPVFALVVTPSIAYLLSKEDSALTLVNNQNQPKEPEAKSAFPGRIIQILKEFEIQEALSKMHIFPALLSVVLIISCLNGGRLMSMQIVNSGYGLDSLPTETLTYIKENGLLKKRGFNYDNWGGYLSYKLKTRVFIDDRADFYERKFYYDYSKIMDTGSGWQKVLKSYKIDWVLFPKSSKLAKALRKDSDFKEVSSDNAASVFVRIDHTKQAK